MGTTNLIQQMVPFIGMGFTIGSVVFQVGKQSEKLDIVNLKVEAQEKKHIPQMRKYAIYTM